MVLLPGLGVRTDQEEVPAATVWKVYEREEGGGRRVAGGPAGHQPAFLLDSHLHLHTLLLSSVPQSSLPAIR